MGLLDIMESLFMTMETIIIYISLFMISRYIKLTSVSMIFIPNQFEKWHKPDDCSYCFDDWRWKIKDSYEINNVEELIYNEAEFNPFYLLECIVADCNLDDGNNRQKPYETHGIHHQPQNHRQYYEEYRPFQGQLIPVNHHVSCRCYCQCSYTCPGIKEEWRYHQDECVQELVLICFLFIIDHHA